MNNNDDLIDAGDLMVLVRIEHHRIDRLRSYSENCRLDADDVPFIWLDDVPTDEEIQWLADLVKTGEPEYSFDHVVETAVSAIAMQDHRLVQPTLEQFIALNQPAELREHTVFWIGAAGDASAVDVLERILRDDPSADVREKAVFALTLPDVPEATDALIRLAREDRSPEIRGDALFWLSQEAGEKASEAIEDAIENDPDAGIKEKAIFALSQLPEDRGIPLLINVAKTNRNPGVRKQAIFWLGQSEDPRVLDFFEDVLAR